MQTKKVEEREAVVLENHGQKIFGIFHKPLSQKRTPAILMCHGLAGQKTGKNRLYVLLAQRLAKMGIAVLRIDFRGSGDSEGDFSEMTLEGEIEDTLLGLQFLKNHPQIDPDRVGLFGRSLGGAVAVVAAQREKRIKSLVLWAPMFSAAEWLDKWRIVENQELSKKERDALMMINGQQAGYQFFKELFNLRLEHELAFLQKIPFLHIHGEKDSLVNIVHAEKYKQCRMESEAETRFIRLPNSDHEFSCLDEREMAIHETLVWFEKTLLLTENVKVVS